MQILTNRDANRLMHEGSLALSKVQSNGMRIDVDYCLKAQNQLVKDIVLLEEKIKGYRQTVHWQKVWGERFNIGSDQQLSYVLFDYMDLQPKGETKSKAPAMTTTVLEELAFELEESDNNGAAFIRDIMRRKKLEKALGTYIGGLLRETNAQGFLHPFFALNTAVTYRSSSYSINFQNIPTRDDEIKKLIRTAFLPREGRQILEVDFKGIEVCVAYCYHDDPTMREYLLDPTKDMHRDMAMQLYILGPDEWNKKTRHAGKNKFVFPEFYGSYFKQVAPDLWKAIALNGLHVGKNNDGIDLREHLRRKGIKTYDAFESHIQTIEDHFWNKRFPVYAQWKEDWYRSYRKIGYFDSHSGFRYRGLFKKNEAINYPVQGSAFHCLLWTLVHLQRWLEENNMRSLIIGQIHDSIVLDIIPKEKDAILGWMVAFVKNGLPKIYPWLTIPMSVEAEITPIGESWFSKKEISLEQYS